MMPNTFFPQCNECEEPCATLLLAQHTPLPCHRRASLFLQPCPMGVGQVTVEVREGTAKGKLVVKVRVDNRGVSCGVWFTTLCCILVSHSCDRGRCYS